MEMTKIPAKPMNPVAFNAGVSPFACLYCGNHASKTVEHHIRSTYNSYRSTNTNYCECGQELSMNCHSLTVLPSSAPMLDKEVAKTSTWFHATNMHDWLQMVTSEDNEDELGVPYVHLGSREAALELAKWKYLDDYQHEYNEVFLWQVTINPEAVMVDGLVEDNNDWFYTVTDSARKRLGGDALRYLNKWEASGSISLLADPRYLTAVRVDEVTMENYSAILKGNEALVTV